MKTENKIELSVLQQKLKAPKSQLNKFGGFKYRSFEEILESVKPLLGTAHLNTTYKPICVGERYYIEATVSLIDKGEVIGSSVGVAREPDSKKGMDDSQLTGSCSSYAAKFAISGLLAIDDTKDADTKEEKEELTPELIDKDGNNRWNGAKKSLENGEVTIKDIKKHFKLTSKNEKLLCLK